MTNGLGEGAASRRRTNAFRFVPAVLAVILVVVLFFAFNVLGGVESVLFLVIAIVFFVALWLLVVESDDPSSKDVGVALLTGLVLAGAAFVLNYLLGEALDNRDRERRESEVRLAINRLQQQVFRGEDLGNLDLSGLDMSAVDDEFFDLSFADLSEADLSSANLRQAQLRKADLTDATFTGADLSDSVLRGARLTGASFCHADLSGSDLTDHEGSFSECETTVMDSETVCGSGDHARFDAESDRFTCASSDGAGGGEQRSAVGLFVLSRAAPAGTIVGQVVGTSTDGDVLRYEIEAETSCSVNCPHDLFDVDSATGVVTTNAELDGLPDRFQLVVVVTDDQGKPAKEELQVLLEPRPQDADPEATVTFLVRPDAQVESRVGRVEPPVVDDGDPAETIRYRIIAPADDRFLIDETTGEVTLNHAPEPGRSHAVTVSVVETFGSSNGADGAADEDEGGTRLSTVSLRIKILTENEPPVVEAPSTVTVAANAGPGKFIALVGATDPDGETGLRYSLEVAASADADDCRASPDTSFDIDELGTIVLVGGGVTPGRCILDVTVRDRGVPAMAASTAITVDVVDELGESVEDGEGE